MKGTKLCLIILLSTLLLAGCATASFTQTGEEYPAYDGIVRVFFEKPEEVEYEKIGIVSSKGGSIHDQADMIKALQKEAAEHGANAIIVVSADEKQGAVLSSGQYGTFASTTTEKNMTAVAIRLRD